MKPLRELVLNCISTEEVVHPVLLVDRCLLNGLKGFRAVLYWFECCSGFGGE